MRLTTGSAPVTNFDFFELGLLLLCLLLAFMRPWLFKGFFAAIERKIVAVSDRGPWVCALIVFVLPIALRLLLLPVYKPPLPFVHDEYSYLLQGDTFASGRITNPPPAFPDEFETVYVFATPTYASEYQPAQGFFLAIGEKIFNCPWAGVLLSMGLFCAITYWAFLAWLSPRWALFGGVLMAVEIGVLSYWMNSYWGGCVPGIGGSLALGALARLRTSFRPLHAFMLTFGVFVVLSSRPFEGVLLSLLVAGLLVAWLAIRKLTLPVFFKRVFVPILVVSAPAALFFAYYNHQVTGKALQMPYLLYRARYSIPVGFYWQKLPAEKPGAPVDIDGVYKDQARERLRATELKGLLAVSFGKVRGFWTFYVGILLTPVLFAIPFIWRRQNMDIAFFALLLILFLENLTYYIYFPHYSAAVAVVIFVCLFHCLSVLRSWRPAGLFLSRTLPLACGVSLAVAMSGKMVEPALPPSAKSMAKLWYAQYEHGVSRERFVSWLEAQPGKQLVLIHYNPLTHSVDNTWTYNQANLIKAKIVWARESSDPNENRRLIEYFRGRNVWLAEPDAIPQRIVPYPGLNQLAKAQ